MSVPLAVSTILLAEFIVPALNVAVVGAVLSIVVILFVATIPACPVLSNATAVIVQLLVIVNVPPLEIAVPVVLVGIVPSVVYRILL